jgi:hypothetical protein
MRQPLAGTEVRCGHRREDARHDVAAGCVLAGFRFLSNRFANQLRGTCYARYIGWTYTVKISETF